jgi:PAS domain S-box-containing protein
MLNNGELVATHAFFNDISELSVVKKELASKDVLLETIFKSIPLCLYLKDYDGKYVFANDMMMQTIGWDVIGKTDHDIFDEESAELLKQKDQEAIAFEHQNNKFTFINEIKGEKKHFYCGKKSISTENQKKLIFGYTVDITELRNKAAKVEESERILNQIVSNTNSGIMLFKLDNSDNSYKIDYINNTCQKIINYNGSKTELTALLPDLQLDTQFGAENGALISQVYEYASNLSGTSHYYDVFINRIDLQDHDHKLLVLFNDVNEKRNMIDKLELKLKENVLLLSEVHHRVKNNLANIYGIIELNKYKFHNTNFEEYLIEVQLKIKSIAIVHDLLYKSKSISRILLNDYFTELCHEYKKIYKSTQQLTVNFDLKFDDNIAIELGRAINLGLMLGELLSNSLKFGSKNKEVTVGISIKLANGRCYIEYTDSGDGFETASLNTPNSGFGMKLIQNVLKQIKANFVLNHDKNFNLSIDFEQI